MNRRDFLKAAGLGAASLAIETPRIAAASRTEKKPNRPNLLIIHTDQLSSWAVSIYAKQLTRTPNYGKVLVETPNIDALARQGAMLNNFFTNSAVSTPSRGCLLTGRYPHCHGAYRNNIELNRDEITIAKVLRRNGYETGYAGKWHLDGPPKPGWMKPQRSMGFSDCRFMFNRGHWKKIADQPDGSPKVSPYKVIGDEQSFTTDYLADKTIEFIKKDRKNPFFYMVSIPDPHGPYTVREPYMSMYDPKDMTIPNTLKKSSPAGKRSSAESRLRLNKARYCGLVKCIDHNVGRIVAALKDMRLLDDTIILFTTDHGDYMGEHGLYGKNQWYRTAYQIPFIIRWPERIPPGTVVDNFVTNVDVQQTLLVLMGVEPSARTQGRDASPLLRGQKIDWPNEAMIHHSSLKSAGIFTPDHELVLAENGRHMLFDRIKDPEQTENLFGKPPHAATVRNLAARILQHHKELKSPALSWLNTQVEKLAPHA